MKHGTTGGYTRGCRCDECSAARRDYDRAMRARWKEASHANKAQRRAEAAERSRQMPTETKAFLAFALVASSYVLIAQVLTEVVTR